MSVANSVLDLIGQTPLVDLSWLLADRSRRLLAKAEFLNPGGSIKDRVAAHLIARALQTGRLARGQTVVELTSGNMGCGLALACGHHGLPFVAVMSAGNSPERAAMMRALGATVELVPQAAGGLPGQVSGADLALVAARAAELVAATDGWYVDQFHNPDNVGAHESSTGPEIWEQSGGRVDAVVAAAGTGCSFVGAMRYLRRQQPLVQGWVVEPAGAAVLAGEPVTKPGHVIQGTGYGSVPPQWEPALCTGSLAVSDDAARRLARRLAAEAGLFVGFSAGANVAAAVRLASHPAAPRCLVTLLPDSGLKYLSTDLVPA
ncbi:MAG: cysteine synthase family protein [Fimbriimonadaceae bacterium]|nr:cysteine synthase family protein [Fimbriimonadaceae bacterium]